MAGAECRDRYESADEVDAESLSSPCVPAPPVSCLRSLFVPVSFSNSDRSKVSVGCWRGEEEMWCGLGGFSMGLQGRIPLISGTARPCSVKNSGSSDIPGAGLPQWGLWVCGVPGKGGRFSMGLQGRIPVPCFLVTAQPCSVKNRGSSGFLVAGLPQEYQ